MALEELFSSEVMRWRYTRALCCIIFLQALLSTIVCNTYRILITDKIWNPLTISYNLFYATIKPYWIFSLMAPSIALIFITRIHVKSYSVKSWIPSNRWEYAKRLLSPRVLVSILIMTASSTYLLHHYASMADPHFASFIIPCTNGNGFCLNHQAMIVLWAGIYLGLSFSLQYFGNNGNLVSFLPEQPNKIESVKSLLSIRIIRAACTAHGVTLSMFCGLFVFYISLGGLVSQWISKSLLISVNELSGGWFLWNFFMDAKLLISLFLVVYLTSSLLATILSLFLQVFNIFISERLEIPIEEVPTNDGNETNSWRLCHTLLSNCELLQYLSFLDFYKMATNTSLSKRRNQIFLISQPGGHPHNWQGVLDPSLNLIRKFTERLGRHNCPEEYAAAKKDLSTDANKNVVPKSVKNTLAEKFDQLVSRIKRYPIFCYFLADLPDVTNRQIFSDAQPVIWSIQGLCELIACSFKQDRYGIFQRNIPEIISAIINLQQVLDKVSRVTVVRRSGTSLLGVGCGDSPLADVQLRKALRLALRSSLYTVTDVFGDTIREINVPSDVQAKLQSYLSFKEG